MNFFALVNILGSFFLSVGETALDPVASRSIYFEAFRVGEILTGFHIQTQLKVSPRACAQLCLRVPQCLSFSYCESRECQLDSRDEFS